MNEQVKKFIADNKTKNIFYSFLPIIISILYLVLCVSSAVFCDEHLNNINTFCIWFRITSVFASIVLYFILLLSAIGICTGTMQNKKFNKILANIMKGDWTIWILIVLFVPYIIVNASCGYIFSSGLLALIYLANIVFVYFIKWIVVGMVSVKLQNIAEKNEDLINLSPAKFSERVFRSNI